MYYLCWIITCFSFFSCQATENDTETGAILWRDSFPTEAIAFQLPYDLKKPKKTFKLPSELDEISGLDISSNGKRLIAVQDEEGDVFYLSTKSGKVKRQFRFHKDGDYEGIEMVNGRIYVLKSTGTLYEIENPNERDEDDLEVNKFNDHLDSSHNVEGLAYDDKNNRLLMACKGNGKEDYDMHKHIYSFDLATHTVDMEPIFSISQEDIMTFLGVGDAVKKLEQFSNKIDPSQSYFGFSPSAVAIHPQTANIYVTSSVGKLLIVLNPQGQMLHIEKLDKKIHRQPEGLAFAKNGTLYISSEGKKGAGKIQVFKMK
ncbi:MAG: SdiA-regulated domain-containing protein [Saprospiraceae bacterium]